MRLAARMGLSVAPVQPGVVVSRSFLLVERYDRRVTGDGTIKRLHQEDFCQALGVPPAQKYASEGGPTFARCFDLVRRVCTRPAREVLKLLDAAILQMLLGNADAHGKNYSLRARPDGSIEVAPLYDMLLSTVAYPDLSPMLAMKIAGRGRLRQAETWRLGPLCRERGPVRAVRPPASFASCAVPWRRLGRVQWKNSFCRASTRKLWRDAPEGSRNGRGGWPGVCDSSTDAGPASFAVS